MLKAAIAAALGLGAWMAAKVALLRHGIRSGYQGRHRSPTKLEQLIAPASESTAIPAGPSGEEGGRHERDSALRQLRFVTRSAPLAAAVATVMLVIAVAGWIERTAAPGTDGFAAPTTTMETTATLPDGPATVDTDTFSTSSTTKPSTSPTTLPDPDPMVRGIFGRDSSSDGTEAIRAAGFNTVIVGAVREELDAVHQAGLRGVVWLGEYDRTVDCDFEFSDGKVIADVTAIAGHPAIVAYFLADEPSNARAESCPSAPDDLRERSDLVHSLDPSNPTMVTLTTWDGVETFPYSYWAGAADIFGLVVYPCFQGSCDFSLIDQAIVAAESAGFDEIWAVIQDFADSWYDLPTPDQVTEQFIRWFDSDVTGYLVFAADGFACCTASDFETNPAKRRALQAWNES